MKFKTVRDNLFLQKTRKFRIPDKRKDGNVIFNLKNFKI